MKDIKKIFVLIMAVCLMLCLCACGEDTEGTKEPAADATQAATDVATEVATDVATEVPSEEPTAEPFSYKIKLVDETGNPFAGVMVQLCKDTCMPMLTDENGVASFVKEEAEGYKGAVTVLPEGYDHIQENVDEVVEEGGVTVYYYYFEDGSNELTITLKKIA